MCVRLGALEMSPMYPGKRSSDSARSSRSFFVVAEQVEIEKLPRINTVQLHRRRPISQSVGVRESLRGHRPGRSSATLKSYSNVASTPAMAPTDMPAAPAQEVRPRGDVLHGDVYGPTAETGEPYQLPGLQIKVVEVALPAREG